MHLQNSLYEAPNLLHCLEQKPLKTLFLPYAINKWNKLDPEIRRIDSYVGFWNKLLSFIKPTEFKNLSFDGPLGIKFLNRLRVDFSYLHEHKFRHNSRHFKSFMFFFLDCRNYTSIRITFMNELHDMDNSSTSR